MLECLNAWMLECLNAWMLECLNAWMLECLNAWMLECLNAWMLGCLDAWMLECLNAWMLEYLNAWIRAGHPVMLLKCSLPMPECVYHKYRINTPPPPFRPKADRQNDSRNPITPPLTPQKHFSRRPTSIKKSFTPWFWLGNVRWQGQSFRNNQSNVHFSRPSATFSREVGPTIVSYPSFRNPNENSNKTR